MRFALKLSLIVALILSIGCSQQPSKPREVTPPSKENIETQLKNLLISAWKATSPTEAAKLRLKATQLLVNEDQLDRAASVFKLITPSKLSQTLSETYVYIGLQLAEYSNDATIAQLALNQDSEHLFASSPLDVRRDILNRKLIAYDLLSDHLTSALVRIENASMFTEEAYWVNHEIIWSNLSLANTGDLSKLNSPPPQNYDLAGWLSLAINIKQNQYNLDEQLVALSQWKQLWPGHPATLKLPEELEILSTLPEMRPENIVLALPLTGQLANAGKAVREGFMAAYYNDPFRNKNKTEITVVDTATSDNFSELYLDISLSDPDLIIGPLSKDGVNELSTMPTLPTPVLALNYSNETDSSPDNLYQFGLSNDDEITQVSEYMWNSGVRHVISICPENQWGWRACEQVRSQWEAKNGIILETAFFDPKGQHTKKIESIFRVDESKKRAAKLNRILPERAELTPRRRQDIDAVVLLSRPKNARQIKPLLAFFYAGNIPVYSTSTIYSGKIDKTKDQDLNGITFTDIPWILNRTNYLKAQLHNKQPELTSNYDRLFALGADAYLLAPRVSIFDKINTAFVNGNTGLLKMTKQRKIKRTLDWATFSDGEAKADSAI